MPNAIALLALLSWPLVTVVLWQRLDPARALIWTILGAYLILPPSQAVIALPGLPDLDKYSISNLMALACAVFLLKDRVSFLPESWLGRCLVGLYVFSPFATVLTNDDPVVGPGLWLPGMTLYDPFPSWWGRPSRSPLFPGTALSGHALCGAGDACRTGGGRAGLCPAHAGRGAAEPADQHLGLWLLRPRLFAGRPLWRLSADGVPAARALAGAVRPDGVPVGPDPGAADPGSRPGEMGGFRADPGLGAGAGAVGGADVLCGGADADDPAGGAARPGSAGRGLAALVIAYPCCAACIWCPSTR
ncbi:MAG: hypothetical protein HZT43_20110 [Exiguobacterium profundum]|nr:MAG: hypothetical protein HZT43_20110 [Exiguobacterium profundum]